MPPDVIVALSRVESSRNDMPLAGHAACRFLVDMTISNRLMFRARTPMITSHPVWTPKAVRALWSNGSSGILTARLIEGHVHLVRTTEGLTRRAM